MLNKLIGELVRWIADDGAERRMQLLASISEKIAHAVFALAVVFDVSRNDEMARGSQDVYDRAGPASRLPDHLGQIFHAEQCLCGNRRRFIQIIAAVSMR